MSGTFNQFSITKETLKRENRDMAIGGLIAVFIAYFAIIIPDVPSVENRTWKSLLFTYGASFYMGFSFVAGWNVLEKFTAKYFLFLPLIGWLFYFIIKVALSFGIGMFCFYSVFRFFMNLFKINQMNNKMENDGYFPY